MGDRTAADWEEEVRRLVAAVQASKRNSPAWATQVLQLRAVCNDARRHMSQSGYCDLRRLVPWSPKSLWQAVQRAKAKLGQEKTELSAGGSESSICDVSEDRFSQEHHDGMGDAMGVIIKGLNQAFQSITARYPKMRTELWLRMQPLMTYLGGNNG